MTCLFSADDVEVRAIAAVFAVHGWTWDNRGTGPFIPTAEDIAQGLTDLLDAADDVRFGPEDGHGRYSSGRLFVECPIPSVVWFGIDMEYQRTREVER